MRALRIAIERQLAAPSGFWGRLIASRMARRNRSLNEAALHALAPGPGQRVLEIGFGPGTLLEELGRRTGPGLVAGVDVSPLMVEAATARHRSAIAAGRLDLVLASVDHLPYPDTSFDGALCVNGIYFWPDPGRALDELRRVLRPGGRLVLALRVRPGTPALGGGPFRPFEVEEVTVLLTSRGFAIDAVDVVHGRDCDDVCVGARVP